METDIPSRVRLALGDITRLDVEAIVTAANQALCGGGGVDGAVHRAAGPQLVRASMALAPCPPGAARITVGFNLSARFVIHAVGPIFHELRTDSAVLAETYQSALSLAAQHHVRSLAVPCISTGAFGFPPDAACQIATATVIQWLQTHAEPRSVTFCCFEIDDHSRYQRRLNELGIVS